MKSYALSLTILMLIANGAIAAEGCNPPPVCGEVQTCGSSNCCAHCGCHACCEKYCRIVCEMKEIKKTVWVVKCEDFCAPLPGCPLHCGECCESGNQECCKEPACENGCDKCCNPCASSKSGITFRPSAARCAPKKPWRKKKLSAKSPYINAWWFTPVQTAVRMAATAGIPNSKSQMLLQPPRQCLKPHSLHPCHRLSAHLL